VTGPQHANTILAHELIHAIDVCRAKMDPLRNCMQLACTEIRAENLSGECNMSWEFLRARLNGYFGHGKDCVRRRAVDSVKANPNCTAKAELYVDAAMERCYADTFPFERHPNQR
jgi:inner membrane protease ATP23